MGNSAEESHLDLDTEPQSLSGEGRLALQEEQMRELKNARKIYDQLPPTDLSGEGLHDWIEAKKREAQPHMDRVNLISNVLEGKADIKELNMFGNKEEEERAA